MDCRVIAFWASAFGVAPQQFVLDGAHVIPNAGKVVGRGSSWIFGHGATCLIPAPPGLVADLQRKAKELDADALQSLEGIQYLLDELQTFRKFERSSK